MYYEWSLVAIKIAVHWPITKSPRLITFFPFLIKLGLAVKKGMLASEVDVKQLKINHIAVLIKRCCFYSCLFGEILKTITN